MMNNDIIINDIRKNIGDIIVPNIGISNICIISCLLKKLKFLNDNEYSHRSIDNNIDQ